MCCWGYIYNIYIYKFFNIIATLNYTYTDVTDLPNNIRIARDVVNASIGYDISKFTNILASYQYRGRREDSDFRSFPSEAVTLKEYNLLDFQVNQKVDDVFSVFARVSNIFNENYQEVLGFETKGRYLFVWKLIQSERQFWKRYTFCIL